MGLRDQVLRQRREAPGGDMEGVFIAEGDIVIQRALSAGYKLHSLLIDEKRNLPLPDALQLPVNQGAFVIYAAGREVVEAIAGYRSYRGALGCFRRLPLPTASQVANDPNVKTVVVTEGINNPTNMGVIMRCAAGLGIDALLADPTSCDPLSRRCCRVSMGEGFSLPHARLAPLPDGLEVLSDAGYQIVALTPRPDAIALADLQLRDGDRVALCLGAEGPGLTSATIAQADSAVRIPMSGTVDSINVGTAAAVAFYGLQQARHPPEG